MLEKDNVIKILEKVLNYWQRCYLSSADEIEVSLIAENSSLTRFANSYIHQNMALNNAILTVKVVLGKKIGYASSNLLDDNSIKEVVGNAIALAKLQKDNPNFKSLPKPKPVLAEVKTFFKETAEYFPLQRAEDIKVIVDLAKEQDLSAYGAYSTNVTEVGVMNSHGLSQYALFTDAVLKIIMMSGEVSGYSSAISRQVNEIDVVGTARIAMDKCLKGKDAIEISPGEYEVILEEPAVSDILLFLGYVGLGALSVQEGRSFMCNNFGKKIVGENITIWDDGLDERGMVLPFDFEGVPKQKVILIENGLASNVVYDSFTAGKEDKESTGHALPGPNTVGPLPTNMFMRCGDSSREEMIVATKKGILVTRFHYTNVVEPMQVIITGMTRDGTFLIENGKITKPVKNLRFTESILKALSNVSMISRVPKLASEGTVLEFASGSVVPTIKIDKFNFSGVSKI